MRHTPVRRCAVAFSVVVCAASPAAAQTFTPPATGSDLRSGASGELSTLALNAAVGGLTAGLARAVHGKSFLRGFVRGAAGGTLSYAGKRVAVERWAGAGLLGRQVNAVGGSVVANAAAGRGALEQVVFAVGPVHVYVDRSAGTAIRPRLDLVSTASLAYALTRSGSHLDLGQSLSAGAPVFYTEGSDAPEGEHAAGVIRVTATRASWEAQGELAVTVAAHERVHVLQRDFAMQVFAVPVQHRLLRTFPGGAVLDRYLDLGLQDALSVGLSAAVPYRQRPWEREAYFLSNRPRDHVGEGEFPGPLY